MKKEITWKDLIKRISLEQKSKGTFRGLKYVFGVAKKEWSTIKSGNHGLFSVGKGTNKSTTTRRIKNKKNKSRKNKMV